MCVCRGHTCRIKKKKVLLELNFEDEWELTQWMRKKKAFQEEVKTHAKHGAIWGLHHDLELCSQLGCWIEIGKEISIHIGISISSKNWFEVVCLKYLFKREYSFEFREGGRVREGSLARMMRDRPDKPQG